MTTPGLPIWVYVVCGMFSLSILVGIPILIFQLIRKNIKDYRDTKKKEKY